jgi:ABC-type amino acid transport substrate-binding protein
MMSRLTLWLAALVFCAVSVTFAYGDGVIRVGVDQNKPSVFYEDDGKVQGFYVDVFEYAAAQEQWQFEYVKGTWSQLLEWLGSGKIDLIVGIAYTEERDKIYDFTEETVFSNWGQLYTKDREIDTVLDLRGKTLAGMKDDVYAISFRTILEKFDVDVAYKDVDAYAGALECVDKGTADAAIVSRVGGMELEGGYDLFRSSVICCPKEIRYATLEGKNAHLLTGLTSRCARLRAITIRSILSRWRSGTR